MPVRDASFSDIERARAITRRLEKTGEEPSAPPLGPSPSPYVRFRAERFAARPLPPPPREPPREPPAFEDWASLIHWVSERAKADAVFVSDVRGLLVALAGGVTHEHAQAMGSRLVLAFEHADRMEADPHAPRFMTVDFGGPVVTGIRVMKPGEEALVLGIASPANLEPSLRSEVEKAFTAKVYKS